MSTTGKKAVKAPKAVDQVTSPEETKVNNAKAQAKSKSPKPNKRGPIESAPEQLQAVRGRGKQSSQAAASKDASRGRSGTPVPPPKSTGKNAKPASKSPAPGKASTAKKGKKADPQSDPEPMSDEEEQKVMPSAKGKGKKPAQSMIEEKTHKSGKKGAAVSRTEEKSKKVGKIIEEPKGVQPTRPLTGYIFFSNEVVPQIVTSEKCSHKDAMRIAGTRWQGLTEEQKKPYQKKNEDDKRRYETQLEELKKKGYFMMSDGTKSTDHADPKKYKVKSTDATPRANKKKSGAK